MPTPNMLVFTLTRTLSLAIDKTQGIFYQAQANLPTPLVPSYAWAEMNTKSVTVPKTLHGMENPSLPHKSTTAWSPALNRHPSASIGNYPEAALAPITISQYK